MSDLEKKQKEKNERVISVSQSDDYFIVPKKVFDVIKGMNESEVKLFLYLCCNKSCSQTQGEEILGISKDDFEGACGYFRGARIFETSNKEQEPKKKMAQASLMQNYDGELIADALEKNKDFKLVAEIAAEHLGKVSLNRNELNSLYNLFDYVGLNSEFICGVIHYCTKMGKASMAYIMKTALSMADSGINTYEQLEEFLKKKEEARAEISKFKSLCGFGNRTLSSKEEKFITRWFEEMCYGIEVVKLAYEITVDKTHEVNFNYMGKILENWFSAGYKNVEDIKNNAKQPATKGSTDSFEVDEFVAAALKKSGY